MKCPNCHYICSDLRDLCPQCALDLRTHKQTIGLAVTYANLSYEELLIKSGKKSKQGATSHSKLSSWLKQTELGFKKTKKILDQILFEKVTEVVEVQESSLTEPKPASPSDADPVTEHTPQHDIIKHLPTSEITSSPSNNVTADVEILSADTAKTNDQQLTKVGVVSSEIEVEVEVEVEADFESLEIDSDTDLKTEEVLEDINYFDKNDNNDSTAQVSTLNRADSIQIPSIEQISREPVSVEFSAELEEFSSSELTEQTNRPDTELSQLDPLQVYTVETNTVEIDRVRNDSVESTTAEISAKIEALPTTSSTAPSVNLTSLEQESTVSQKVVSHSLSDVHNQTDILSSQYSSDPLLASEKAGLLSAHEPLAQITRQLKQVDHQYPNDEDKSSLKELFSQSYLALSKESSELEISAHSFSKQASEDEIALFFDLVQASLIDPNFESRFVHQISDHSAKKLDAGELRQQFELTAKAMELPRFGLRSISQGDTNRLSLSQVGISRALQSAEFSKRMYMPSMGLRLLAFALDLAVVLTLAICSAYMYVSAFDKQGVQSLLLFDIRITTFVAFLSNLLIFSILWTILYGLITVWLFKTTFGAFMFNLRYLTESGSRVKLIHAFVRAAILPLSYLGFGYLPTLLEKRPLHDYMAGVVLCRYEG